jgi:hypothetical protein
MSTNGVRPIDMTLQIVDGDDVHIVPFGSFTALDARVFRLELGMSLMEAFRRILYGQEELDIVTGILWLHQRKDNPALPYEEVAGRFTYDRWNESMAKRAAKENAGVVVAGAAEGKVDGDPEA